MSIRDLNFTSHHWKVLVNPEFVLQASSNKSLNMETNTVSFLCNEENIYFYQVHASTRLSFKNKAFKIQLQSSGLRGITEQRD